MSVGVVCVSGTLGSSMPEVAAGVAARLGFRLVDEEIVVRAAAESGLEPHVVAGVEERRSFLARTLESLAPTADAATFTISGVGAVTGADVPVSDELRGLIRTAIEETAEQGGVVIVSHAASHALAGRDGVLRVLVTAGLAQRCARVAAEQGLGEKDAARAVEFSDGARADYLRRFYKVKTEQPVHYDLVVNTDRIDPIRAAELVALAAAS